MISAVLIMLQAAGLPPCDMEKADQGIQLEMNICAAHDYQKADAALNAQWAITRDKMKAQDEDFAEYASEYDLEQPGYFESLLEAQRAWLTYRDAHCRLDGYNARGGSLEPLLVSTCKTALTEKRTEQLRELAEYPL
jgi:uncharacterized protein YecT (DUF1311 family)